MAFGLPLNRQTSSSDEILMSGVSPGGHSLVADDIFPVAGVAARLVNQSGLASFDPVQLNKALAGKRVQAGPFLSQQGEGFWGKSSPEDLETMLQLVYLSATAPRTDPGVFAAWKAQMTEMIKQRDRNPQVTFFDKFQKTLYRDHPRHQPPRMTDIERVTEASVMKVFQERFANLSDSQFLFVGAVDPKVLKPLVTKYLGNLPGADLAAREKEVAMHVEWDVEGPHLKPGATSKTVRPRVQTAFKSKKASPRRAWC